MERTDQPQPSGTPEEGLQPNRIISEPATPEACQRDYEQGAAERRSSEQRHPGK
ncbi:MAG: hypothetical protein ACRDQ0_06000 [Pseudonocardia sp.]